MKFIIYISFVFLLQNMLAFDLEKAKIYKQEHNVRGWYMSEKLDGIRAYWNGHNLLSKNGNIINAPKYFTKNFPSFSLDGELWTIRNDFENIQSIVLDKKPSIKWKQLTYNIFEVPSIKEDFMQRLAYAKKHFKKSKNVYVKFIEQIKCKNSQDLDVFLENIILLKGEGVIIKKGDLAYQEGRSSNILKVKKFYDAEGLVIGINYKKKNENNNKTNKNKINKKMKSLKIKLPNNIIFNLGGGFSNIQRINHPKIGDIITYKYYGLTKYKKPKFASFLRIRKKE